MKLSDFDYELPKELIAQYPAREREKCRLMVLDRKSQEINHRMFGDIAEYIDKGDCLVLNNTKVIPARLFGRRESGGRVEIFLLEKKNPVCEALVRPSDRIHEGETILLESGDKAEVLGRGDVGRLVRLSRSIDEIMKKSGHMPLPPYIDREDEEGDKVAYQTVYAAKEGATASPTAGLHFTNELIRSIETKGAAVASITLHTSYGTFAPIKTEDVESHRMHRERFELPEKAAETINRTKASGGRIFAVGTTSARTLEFCASINSDRSTIRAQSGLTDLYIYPGYRFKIVDCLVTNFHLPRSTLLLLVSAFAGKEFIERSYREAIDRRYRFFSYGDAMLIL